MHEFRRFIETQMALNNMRPANLARASGLTPQHISQMLNDDRHLLAQMPDVKTIEGLARAFPGITEAMVRAKAVQGLGVPASDTPTMVLDLHDVSVDMLLGEVRRRIEGSGNAQAQEQGSQAGGAELTESPAMTEDERREWERQETAKVNARHRRNNSATRQAGRRSGGSGLSDGDGTTTHSKRA